MIGNEDVALVSIDEPGPFGAKIDPRAPHDQPGPEPDDAVDEARV